MLRRVMMAQAAGGGGGTIADYFASGERGFWVNPADLTSMKQDSAGTTAVTATGQSVGLINDLSGNGHHHSQATSGKRPVLQQDGDGKHYLQFTKASSQFLGRAAELALAPGNDSIVIVAGVQYDTLSDYPTAYSRSRASGITGRYWLSANNSPSNRFEGGWNPDNPAAFTALGAASTGTKYVVTVVIDRVAGTVQLRIDGVPQTPVSSEAEAAISLTPSIKSRIGAYGNSTDAAETTNYMSGRIYGLVVRITPTINLTDVAAIESLLDGYVNP